MKSIFKQAILLVIVLTGFSFYGQSRDLDNYRLPDQRGVHVFEAPKDTISTFDDIQVRIGGASTLQYQAIDHENSGAVGLELKEIGANFNLATANLDLDVVLFDGVRMHLRTYLSSRHHPEPYVKGGYFQIDKLDFISEGFMEDFMKYTTIKIGHMENNYGDAHFRRTDNAQAIYNPFVGNLIMDAFTTEVGAELYYRRNGFIVMLGLANGKLNQSINKSAAGNTGGASFLAKLGYDKQINEDLRFRLTGSLYNTGYVPMSYLYNADRAGSRYYGVMIPATATADDFRSGRYNPNLRNEITAIMINPFIKYKGLEFFGTIETAKGKASTEVEDRTANQFASELIYRFGNTENFFIGGRYNVVDSEEASGADIKIKRTQLGAGWFMTKNILMKLEYVNQTYDGYAISSPFNEGKFKGLMAEAVISF
ncbi:hypothetical protein [Confluentibacter citreus]|uniref:hypothetical protein n=1 Tax=Confluentibacter citreus TaxID=2007307 RepID=UPI000C28C673|nr:hypothetical protein [Confluentibacter citreus]